MITANGSSNSEGEHYGFVKKACRAVAGRFYRKSSFYLLLIAGLLVMVEVLRANGRHVGKAASGLAANIAAGHHPFVPFGFLWSTNFAPYERVGLFMVLGIAVAGLLYAGYLARFVRAADRGTPKMREVALAIREGAQAYLRRQRRTLLPIIGVVTLLLIVTAKWHTAAGISLPFGRGFAFLMGAFFSMLVGTIGMHMAVRGNLRVAAAARTGFGRALQIGYRTGTVTGMLTDALGLLGATLIFMYFGDRAPEALLGFGFGGTLLALFMRVGGGIYTKAADVGADLVGKIEKDIPEDDPRNAATIADNVGDNVGDCAGMAADIFESYEVTMVAAMILGWAAFGHVGVMFPLLVRGIGVLSDIISTWSVRADRAGRGKDGVARAMHSITFGFRTGAVLGTIGFMTLGFFYFRLSPATLSANPVLAAVEAHAPWWANFGIQGLDWRPAEATFCGIALALVLNWCTEYFTGTAHRPVKTLVRSCDTGHATNIIQGLAVGMESSVWAAIIIAGAVICSVLIFAGTNPIFVAYGVAMCGIGMLTLTGNTLSMDVFGPVADNANGIGEMGFDPEEMGQPAYRAARQVLADLDAAGNTTKAITKGIAIGSAVVAALSLFASFVIIVGSGGGSDQSHISMTAYRTVSGLFNVADPRLFVGLLIGGAVPFLFSSMAIRAVGRAAYLIVQECRVQFRDKAIWTRMKKPDYGRVVEICTLEAQRELIGPGLLAVLAPVLVGFLIGVQALAGFLAGAILTGQLLAVFMANSGGAWDNAKKVIEDERRDLQHNTGKGSERHKASVTGDTIGDPLKDTAGPAINPLLKVMNMVALLAAPLLLPFDRHFQNLLKNRLHAAVTIPPASHPWIAWLVVAVCLIALSWAVFQAKHETPAVKAYDHAVPTSDEEEQIAASLSAPVSGHLRETPEPDEAELAGTD